MRIEYALQKSNLLATSSSIFREEWDVCLPRYIFDGVFHTTDASKSFCADDQITLDNDPWLKIDMEKRYEVTKVKQNNDVRMICLTTVKLSLLTLTWRLVKLSLWHLGVTQPLWDASFP